MIVTIPSPLQSYTRRREVEAKGDSAAAVLEDLERQFPGLRFRVVDEQGQLRTHMRLFAGASELRDLAAPLPPHTALHLVHALSGG